MESKSETFEICGGNTNSPQIPTTQLKKWCFTWNNYTENNIKEILQVCETYCLKYGFQTEIGECGTPHLQGAMWLKDKMRWSEFKLPKTIHWEKMKDDKGANDYVQKEDTYSGRRWSKGLKPIPMPVLCIKELRPFQKEIKDIYDSRSFDEFGTNRFVYYFWESKGNFGKTAMVRYLVVNHPDEVIFCKGGKGHDLIYLLNESDMTKCRAVIWDLPRENKGVFSSSTVESVLDGMICNLKFKGKTQVFNAPHVFIFSNYPPKFSDDVSADRWIVKCLDSTLPSALPSSEVCCADSLSESLPLSSVASLTHDKLKMNRLKSI